MNPLAVKNSASALFPANGLTSALISLHHGKMNFSGVIEHAKAVKQPQDDHYHHDNVKNLFDRGLHGNVGVDQPKHDADDDQS
jgi:hypothetical protein